MITFVALAVGGYLAAVAGLVWVTGPVAHQRR